MKNKYDIYVSITCIYRQFIDSSISGSNRQGTFPTHLLEYLVIHNSFVSDVYMEDIAKIKFQFHHLHLEQ